MWNIVVRNWIRPTIVRNRIRSIGSIGWTENQSRNWFEITFKTGAK